ncbi:unnamed protein product, partial [Protopolystoma xenopodis]
MLINFLGYLIIFNRKLLAYKLATPPALQSVTSPHPGFPSMTEYILKSPPVCSLQAEEAFRALSLTEKKYVKSAYESSWIGGLIDLIQTSPESAGIFILFQRIFRIESPEDVCRAARAAGLDELECDNAFAYIAMFYANLGNYKSFGDSKFIPALPEERFSILVSSTKSFKDPSSGVSSLWSSLVPAIYSLNPRRLRLDFGPSAGITTYYSSNCTREDAKIVEGYFRATRTEGYNTRLFKKIEDGKQIYLLKYASAEEKSI